MSSVAILQSQKAWRAKHPKIYRVRPAPVHKPNTEEQRDPEFAVLEALIAAGRGDVPRMKWPEFLEITKLGRLG